MHSLRYKDNLFSVNLWTAVGFVTILLKARHEELILWRKGVRMKHRINAKLFSSISSKICENLHSIHTSFTISTVHKVDNNIKYGYKGKVVKTDKFCMALFN